MKGALWAAFLMAAVFCGVQAAMWLGVMLTAASGERYLGQAVLWAGACSGFSVFAYVLRERRGK